VGAVYPTRRGGPGRARDVRRRISSLTKALAIVFWDALIGSACPFRAAPRRAGRSPPPGLLTLVSLWPESVGMSSVCPPPAAAARLQHAPAPPLIAVRSARVVDALEQPSSEKNPLALMSTHQQVALAVMRTRQVSCHGGRDADPSLLSKRADTHREVRAIDWNLIAGVFDDLP